VPDDTTVRLLSPGASLFSTPIEASIKPYMVTLVCAWATSGSADTMAMARILCFMDVSPVFVCEIAYPS